MSWQFTDASQRVVSRTNADGSMESHLATDKVVVDFVTAGGVIAAPPSHVVQDGVAVYTNLINGGLAVTSASAPLLSATYATGQQAEFNIVALETSLAVNGTFPRGAITYAYPDATGARHTMTVVQFKALATAIGDFVTGCQQGLDDLLAGRTPTWPAATATIP